MKEVTNQELHAIGKAAKYNIDKIYIHWTAGRYGQYFDDYHICVDANGSIMVSTTDLTELKAHTWRRNSNAVGIAMCCCYNATTSRVKAGDFGEYPPTPEMIDATAQAVAILCHELGLAINKNNVMTHCEAAEEDDYGPSTTCERWDLWYLPDVPGDGQLQEGGDVIRGKAIWWDNEGI